MVWIVPRPAHADVGREVRTLARSREQLGRADVPWPDVGANDIAQLALPIRMRVQRGQRHDAAAADHLVARLGLHEALIKGGEVLRSG